MVYVPTLWKDGVTELDEIALNKIELGIAMAYDPTSITSALIISVKDYGAVGDGVTDDTEAVQAAIDSLTSTSTLFFPSTGIGFYKVSSLTIPSTVSDLSLVGAGIVQTYLKFTSLVCVSVQTNGIHFEGMRVEGPGIDVDGTVLFQDNRTNNTEDFDISFNTCYLSESETVVSAKGHGISFDNCFFYDIRYRIMLADFPPLALYVPGSQNTQLYTSGMRGYVFRNCRVHYSPCVILENLGANALNLSGVIMTGNVFEGSVGYVNGYVRNMEFGNNVHYECGNVREALFMFNGCDNVNISMQVTGKQGPYEGTSEYCNRIIGSVPGSTKSCNNLSFNGNICDVFKDAFHFVAGGTNIDLHVVGKNLSQDGPGTFGLVLMEGAAPYDGIRISGVIASPHPTFTAIRRTGNLVQNYNIDLEITGDYSMLDNLDGGVGDGNGKMLSYRKPVTGVYAGNGGTLKIQIPFESALVQIAGNNYQSTKSSFSNALSPEITINADGFTVTDGANFDNQIYSFIAR